MFNSPGNKITDMERVFLEPANSTHRQYEALRAYFVDGLPSAETAARFSYSPGSFRVLCHQLRQNPQRQFFLPPQKGPRRAPKKETLREKVVALRKQNLSIYDINEALAGEGQRLSPAAISIILKEEGFAPGDLALRRPRSQICDSWISRHGASALSSVACFSFYPLWCRLVSTVSSAAPAYPARR